MRIDAAPTADGAAVGVQTVVEVLGEVLGEDRGGADAENGGCCGEGEEDE